MTYIITGLLQFLGCAQIILCSPTTTEYKVHIFDKDQIRKPTKVKVASLDPQ